MDVDDPHLLLTYHLLRAAGECPVKLFYYRDGKYPDFGKDDPFKKHLRRNKKLLIQWLQQRFPDGRYAGPSTPADEQSRRTMKLLEEGHDTIFDARFTARGCTVRVPVLHRQQNQLILYQVECRTFDPNHHRLIDHKGRLSQRWKGYIKKLAFKKLVVSWAMPDFEVMPQLMLPNKNYVAGPDELPGWILGRGKPEESNYQEKAEDPLLIQLDAGEAVNWILSPPASSRRKPLEKRLAETQALLEKDVPPEPRLGVKCGHCEFRPDHIEERRQPNGFDNCWKTVGDYPREKPIAPVLDLIGTDATEWLNKKIFWMRDVPESMSPTHYDRLANGRGRITMRDRQLLQINQAAGTEVPEEIIKKPLEWALEQWNWPLHFLDFEAASFPIPLRPGGRPFEPAIFQFSCHTLHRDGRLEHHDFIHPTLDPYPNYEIARAILDIPQIHDGTIIQYSPFEKQGLKIIKRQLRDEKEGPADRESLYQRLQELLREGPDWADMSRLVRDYYFNRYMNGSLGVKEVVRSMFRFSPVLRDHYSQSFRTHHWDSVIFWNGNGNGGSTTGPYDHSSDEGEVGQGTEALWAFGHLQFDALAEDERDELVEALLRYCELDTLSMVMIYQHWIGQIAAKEAEAASNEEFG